MTNEYEVWITIETFGKKKKQEEIKSSVLKRFKTMKQAENYFHKIINKRCR
jgi:hypothetical protein